MRARIIVPTNRHHALATLTELLRARETFDATDVIVGDRIGTTPPPGAEDLTFAVVPDRPESAVDLIARLRPACPGPLIAVGPAHDAKVILNVIRAGADTYLDEADLASEFATALDRFHAKRHRGEAPRRLLAVVSAAGGCGASTVAANLAVVLARRFGRCHLIDMNPSQADLASLLDVKPPYTMSDLFRNEGRLDRTMYEKLLTAHSSGVMLLAAPRTVEDFRAVTTDAVAHALAIAREVFADVVVDLEDCLHDEQLLVLGAATTVFVVSRPDFTTARNTRVVIDRLVALGVPRGRIEVVLNQTGRPSELPRDDVETALGGAVAHALPFDPDRVGWSNNTGLPVAIRDPDCPFVRGVAGLVGLAAEGPPAPTLPGRVRAWVGEAVLPRLRTLWRRGARRPDDDTVESLTILEDTDTSHEPNPAPQRDPVHDGAVAS
jgi:pilus assembly protein CpaE